MFAGVIGLAARFVVAFLATTLPSCMLVRRVVGVALCCDKTAVLCWGASGIEEVRAAHRQARGVLVVPAARMRGMILGLDSLARRWAAPTQKYLARVRRVRGLALGSMDRVLARAGYARAECRSLFGPVRSHLDGGVARAEQLAMAVLTAAPMHSMGPGIAEHLSALGTAWEFAWRVLQGTLAAVSSNIAGSEKRRPSCRGTRSGSPPQYDP